MATIVSMLLSQYLHDQKISAAEFGRRIGLSRSMVVRLCSGERSPSLDVLGLIATETDNAVGMVDFLASRAAPIPSAEPSEAA